MRYQKEKLKEVLENKRIFRDKDLPWAERYKAIKGELSDLLEKKEHSTNLISNRKRFYFYNPIEDITERLTQRELIKVTQKYNLSLTEFKKSRISELLEIKFSQCSWHGVNVDTWLDIVAMYVDSYGLINQDIEDLFSSTVSAKEESFKDLLTQFKERSLRENLEDTKFKTAIFILCLISFKNSINSQNNVAYQFINHLYFTDLTHTEIQRLYNLKDKQEFYKVKNYILGRLLGFINSGISQHYELTFSKQGNHKR